MPATLCRIVLTVVSCTVDPSTPAPSPAAAIAIITASLGPSRVPPPAPPLAPAWFDVTRPQTYDRDWPFTGSFAPTWLPTDRRLDGTSLFDPFVNYGNSAWLFGGPGVGPGLFGGATRRGGSRPGAREPRPIAHPPVVQTPGPAPGPPVHLSIGQSAGSVRTKVGRE
jgi:hypothetical protein